MSPIQVFTLACAKPPSLIEVVYLIAIAHVWSRGTIFQWLREREVWRPLANCPLCSGFWIGVLGHALFQFVPDVIRILGIGSLVGTATLIVYCAIRAIPAVKR